MLCWKWDVHQFNSTALLQFLSSLRSLEIRLWSVEGRQCGMGMLRQGAGWGLCSDSARIKCHKCHQLFLLSNVHSCIKHFCEQTCRTAGTINSGITSALSIQRCFQLGMERDTFLLFFCENPFSSQMGIKPLGCVCVCVSAYKFFKKIFRSQFLYCFLMKTCRPNDLLWGLLLCSLHLSYGTPGAQFPKVCTSV